MDRDEYIAKWAALPVDFRRQAVEILKSEMSETFFFELRGAAKEDPEWWAKHGWHFGQGMQIRNILRDNGLTDDYLPDQNWDDYYVQALEEAAGIIDTIGASNDGN